jgi:hypothetical protein
MIELLLICIENTHAILILMITVESEVRYPERHVRWCFAPECKLDFKLLAIRAHVYLPAHIPMTMKESRVILAEYILVHQVRQFVEEPMASPVG